MRLTWTQAGARVRTSSAARVAIEGVRFAYYVGLPYIVLLGGAFTTRDIGLQGSPAPDLILGWAIDDWARAIGHAATLSGICIFALITLIWQIRRASGRAELALGIRYSSLASSIRDAVYTETHWSFYRVLPIVLLNDIRWAALGGLGIVMVEALLGGRAAPRSELEPIHKPLFNGLLATLSATYFAMTGGNVWVAILLQITIRQTLSVTHDAESSES